MKISSVIILFAIAFYFACKTKQGEVQPQKYFLVIDALQKTGKGPVDTNLVEEIASINDKSAIIKGLEKYYNTVVSIEQRDKGIEPPVPYVLIARGWAILDAKGEDVKSRVSSAFIDSCTENAIQSAKNRQQNLQIQ